MPVSQNAAGVDLAQAIAMRVSNRGQLAATGEAVDETVALNPVVPAQANADGPRLPGSPAACVVNAMLPYSRSGIMRYSNGTVGEAFEVLVDWASAPDVARGSTSYCAAECGEYHQFIKGHMFAGSNSDGSDLKDVGGKLFSGLALDENQFREDGLDHNPKARYGHRLEKQTMNESYEPDRLTGTRYKGKDFPSVLIGTFADMDVTFRGDVVDTCKKTVTNSATWRIQYRGLIRP